MSATYPAHHLVLAYASMNPRQPLAEIGSFKFDATLSVLVWERRSYDPAIAADLKALAEAQYKVGKSGRYQPFRVLVMPVAYFTGRIEEAIASRAEASRISAADRAEGLRLADLAALAPEEPPHIPRPADAWGPSGDEQGEEDTEPEAEQPVITDPTLAPDGTVLAYEQWPLEELQKEVAARKLKAPSKAKAGNPIAWISILADDDEAAES